jgi:hypothetical protein
MPRAIRRRVYPGPFERLPDFTKLNAESESAVSEFKIDDIKGRFAATFDSYLVIEETGKYIFRLASDDGARLLIDGDVVIDHDGIHPASEKKKQIKLEAGAHALQVLYFEGGGERELRLEVENIVVGKQAVETMLSATADATIKPLVPQSFKLDTNLEETGKRLFATSGCANCHTKSDSGDAASVVRAKPLSECRPDAGCLASDVPAGLPDYELTSMQREWIATAIHSRDVTSETPEDAVHFVMASMNCYACHVRNGIGGPDAIRNASFITTTPEMGDEGRLPPALTGVGDKLQQDYLRNVVANGADERPYMKTRMPGFGEATLNHLQFIDNLVKLDLRDEGNDGSTVNAPVQNLIDDGRALCGNDGLACIKCHTFGGVGLPGIQAIDMLLMPKRLRRDWFERYLLDPQAYRPGTRMPVSFVDGKSVLVKIADGRPVDQIESMWRYLSQDKDAKVPTGLLIDAIELKAAERPVIYRNFFTGVSPRGIGVGYPEGLNVIWDAQRMGLAMAWKNAFIDASKHWVGRGVGTQDPLGDAVIKLDIESPVAKKLSDSEPWPTDLHTKDNYPFRGYSLDKSGRPTFRYQCGEVVVEDFIEPAAGEGSKRSVRRSLRFQGSEALTLLVSQGNVKPESDGWFLVDERYRIKVDSGCDMLKFGDKIELRTQVNPSSEQPSTIRIQIEW